MPTIRISKRALEKLEILTEENEYEYVDDFASDLILGKIGKKKPEEKISTALVPTETSTTEIQSFTPQEKEQFQEDVFNSLRYAVETRAIQYILEQIKMTSGTANPVLRAKDILKDLSLIFGQPLNEQRLEMALRNIGMLDLYSNPEFGFQDIRGMF